MNAFFFIKQKAKIALLLFVILVIEICNSFSQQTNCSRLGNVVHEVYSDRLIAQDYIYKMNEKIHDQKYRLLYGANLVSAGHSLEKSNSEINELLRQYELTRLTTEEEKVLADLKITVAELQAILSYPKQDKESGRRALSLYKKDIELTFDYLDKLSQIQVSRGKDLESDSARITSYASLINECNSAILIIIGVVIIGITFTSRSEIPKLHQQEYLN